MLVSYLGMKNPLVIIGIISVILLVAAVWFADTKSKEANEDVAVSMAVKGNPDAAVVLEEYADFQCPACGQFHPVVKDIMDLYGDQVRLEFKHFPLITIHPYAEPSARAAEAAGQQGKFFEYHDLLFENQAEWSRSANPSQLFNQYARDLELDMELFARHQKSSVIRDHIREQMNEGRGRGVQGTPTFFLNGEQVTGMATLNDLKTRVEAALGVGQEVASSTEATSTTTPAATTPGSDVRFGF